MKVKDLQHLIDTFTGHQATLTRAKVIASNLPPSVVINQTHVKGKTLLNKGINQDEEGLPILPNEKYIRYFPNQINATKMIISAWKSGKDKAVRDWLTAFLQNHINIQNHFPELINGGKDQVILKLQTPNGN